MNTDIECKEVIVSILTQRGHGISGSPIRKITQVFEKDGTLIAEYDPSPVTFDANDLINFAAHLYLKKILPSDVNDSHIKEFLIEKHSK